jgi:hypothetical protein
MEAWRQLVDTCLQRRAAKAACFLAFSWKDLGGGISKVNRVLGFDESHPQILRCAQDDEAGALASLRKVHSPQP